MTAQFKKIGLNELPAYSQWPARILGISEWKNKTRDESQVIGEYSAKWGKLKNIYQSKSYNDIEDVLVDLFISHFPKELLFHIGEEFYHSPTDSVFWNYIDSQIDSIVSTYCEKDDCIVELGSGWGRNLFNFLKRNMCAKVMGGEYTDEGVALANSIAQDLELPAQFEHFDYYDPDSPILKKVKDCVVFTHNSIEQIPYLKKETFESLLAHKPKAVIHFEPVYEYRQDDTLLHYLWKKYTHINDYSRNLLTILRELESEGKIRIVEERKHMLGLNAFNPGSFIVWKTV